MTHHQMFVLMCHSFWDVWRLGAENGSPALDKCLLSMTSPEALLLPPVKTDVHGVSRGTLIIIARNPIIISVRCIET